MATPFSEFVPLNVWVKFGDSTVNQLPLVGNSLLRGNLSCVELVGRSLDVFVDSTLELGRFLLIDCKGDMSA